MQTLLYAACGAMGLVVGSFLNVVIWRLPRRESLSHPGSHCPVCDSAVRPWDNVPVVSWLVLRGRCRQCKSPISIRYPLVEILTAVLFLAAAVQIGPHWELADYCVFFAVLIAISGIDLDHQIVPNRIVYPAMGATTVLLGAASFLERDGRAAVEAAAGAAVAFAFLFVVHFIQPRGMGFGDVRLSGLIGLNVGWLGLGRVAVALMCGFVLGALVGIGLIAFGRAGRRTRIPFGPFLAGGAIVAVLWGGPIVNAWLGRR